LRHLEQQPVRQSAFDPSPARIEPDATDPALEHRLAVVPELANRVLRVIVSKAEPKRVITAHLDRKMKGKV
jgi:hypothetical protein